MCNLPLIFKRILAFILDLILVGLLSMLIQVSPLNPNATAKEEHEISYQEFMEGWNKRAEGVEDGTEEAIKLVNEYKDFANDYIYDGCKLSIYEEIYTIIITCIYFGIIPLFMEGATLGKKIMKLRVVKKDGEKIGYVRLLLRTIVLFGLPFNIICLIGLAALNKHTFMSLYMVSSMLSYALEFAIIITTLLKEDKRGLHDLIAGTLVEERK